MCVIRAARVERYRIVDIVIETTCMLVTPKTYDLACCVLWLIYRLSLLLDVVNFHLSTSSYAASPRNKFCLNVAVVFVRVLEFGATQKRILIIAHESNHHLKSPSVSAIAFLNVSVICQSGFFSRIVSLCKFPSFSSSFHSNLHQSAPCKSSVFTFLFSSDACEDLQASAR